MKRSRNFKSLAKSGAARTLAMVAAVLLILEPFALALEYKYPTSYTITPVSMGSSMTLEQGVVFGFNSAKSPADADASADLQEAACKTPPTNFTFGTGMEGFSNVAGAKISYNYSGSEGNLAAGAINTRLSRSNASSNFQWNKSFFWDCGTPGATSFSLYYKRGTWTSAGVTNNFQVNIVKPDLVVVPVVASTNITATGWTQVTGTIPANTFNLPGSYTLQLSGTLSGTSNATANVIVHFDDVNLTVTSGYGGFKQETELTIRATPYSSLLSNQYLLDIRARKNAADIENTYIQVYNGVSWTTRYTVSSTTWTTFASYYLTPAEYNSGNVRVRYLDADQTAGDSTQGGVQVEFQRVSVDLGACVDQVTDQEADCGKCHNFGGNITKPWPSTGMHDKHAQTESTSDCLWCHPNNGIDSAHRNGTQGGYAIEVAGTKVYRLGGANPQTAAGSYDTATKRCSTVDCHMGIQSPAWDSVYGTNIERNCSRCHNSGTPGTDNAANLNLSVAWPSTGDGGGHASHNTAFTIDEYSCQTNGSCHPDNRGQHSVVGDNNVVVKMAPSYASPNQIVKYIPDVTNGTGTCANVSCHGGQQTPRFNLANTPPGIGPIDVTNQTGCVKCHTPEGANGWGTAAGNASQYNAPISGLHRGAPPTSGKNHISDYSCTKCHIAAPSKHFKTAGVTNLHTTAMDTVTVTELVTGATGVGTFTAGTGTSPNYTTPPTCATPAGTAGCHAEADPFYRNPTTSWARRWSWDAYDSVTPVNQCKSCHGHWGSFSTGVVEPHVASNGSAQLLNALSSNHSNNANGIDCAQMCHAQTNVAYNHGAAVGATKDMTVNSNAGFVDNGILTVGCNGCHANEGNAAAIDGFGGTHVFADATWATPSSLAGLTPTCYNPGASTGCHGDGVAKYWPDDSPSSYPNRGGKHTYHINRLATKLGIGTTTDADQKRLCQYCHPANPGASGHATNSGGDSIADTSDFNPIWNAINPPTGDVVPAGAFSNDVNATCSGIDCHNNQATTATYNWRTGAVSTCTMCHTRAITGNNPSSGLHYGSTAPTVSGKWHDNTLSTGCTVCHSGFPASATHINGTFTGISTSDANLTIMGLPITAGNRYTATADNVGSCSGAWVGGTSCHGGTVAPIGTGDQGSWARKWNSNISYGTVLSNTPCAGCHGGLTGTDWTFGLVANTTDGSVEHGRNWDSPQDGAFEVILYHKDNLAPASRCNICHVYADAPYTTGAFTTYHRKGSIEMNSAMGYVEGSWNCTSACHTNNALHNLEDSAWPVNPVAGPALTCISCHTGSGTGAFKVGSASSHTDPDGAGATYAAGGNNCAVCHFTSHLTETTNTIAVTWDTRTMGTSYATGDGMIHLKKLAGTETSEAEICWNCHWGTNMPTISPLIKEFGGTQGLYQTGTLNQRNWYGATWTSANFSSYKNGAIASVHQALSSTAVDPVKDTTLLATEVTTLGCVSCHDVHRVGNNGFTPLGQPYLRGSWTSNPFKEDGAPGGGGVATWAIGVRTSTGAVPRGAAMSAVTTNNELGGWQIEQNNAAFTNIDYGTNPTTSFAGLCSKCHTKTGLEGIAWTGHKAAVSGFIGTGGSNVFSSTVRGGTGLWTNAHMGHQGSNARTNSYVGGLRNNIEYNDGIIPKDVTSKPDTGGVAIAYAFGTVKTITMDGATVQPDFHNFPCSKCHSPHASRLPRLMITNCLDVKKNTWDDTKGNPNAWAAVGQTHVAKKVAYASSAGNCHRYVLGTDINREAAAENGWNSVTPW